MSDSWTTGGPGETSSSTHSGGVSEKADTAKHEAGQVASTAADSAKDVAHTAKDEATSVVTEAKSQARDLLHQTRDQLSHQAAAQQERLAGGLRSAGDELGSLARSSDAGGIAVDVVRRASQRLGAAGDWLADRDPAAVLGEVKRFARRRPLAFVAGAAVAGVVVGRLTRALASSGGSSVGADSSSTRPQLPAAPTVPASEAAFGAPIGGEASYAAPAASEASFVAPAAGESPLFDESASRLGEGVPDERRDTV